MPELHEGPFTGPETFRQLVRDALAAAAREGWREIVLADAGFEDWPLGERAVVQALQEWSASGRRCVLLARRYDDVIRRHARFVAWRGTWSHIVDARACPSADASDVPSAIWSPAWTLRRLDPERGSGVAGRDARGRVALREELDRWLARSTPAFPAVTLGL